VPTGRTVSPEAKRNLVERSQGALAEINRLRLIGARQRTHAPRRVSARGRGVWTLAEASVECRVISGATATGADDASHAE
jgi:hypothetical protein